MGAASDKIVRINDKEYERDHLSQAVIKRIEEIEEIQIQIEKLVGSREKLANMIVELVEPPKQEPEQPLEEAQTIEEEIPENERSNPL